jgi:hypothetical protein
VSTVGQGGNYRKIERGIRGRSARAAERGKEMPRKDMRERAAAGREQAAIVCQLRREKGEKGALRPALICLTTNRT